MGGGAVKLDNMSKGQLFATYFVFLALLSGLVALGIYGPKEQNIISQWAHNCNDTVPHTAPFDAASCSGVDMAKGGEFVGSIDNLSKVNQYLIVSGQIYSKKYAEYGVEKDLQFHVKLEGRNDGDIEWKTVGDAAEAEEVRSRSVYCKDGEKACDKITIIHETYITYSQYQARISFPEAQNSAAVDFIADVEFVFTTADRNFTLFEMVFRYMFMAFTLVAIVEYILHTRRYVDNGVWLTENKWVVGLLLSLVLYENPVFGLQLMVANPFFPVLSSLFLVTFIAAIFLFALTMMDGIYKENSDQRGFMSFYFPKIVWTIIFWIGLAIYFAWTTMLEKSDPTFKASDLPLYRYFVGSIFAWLVIWGFWFCHTLFRCWEELAVLRTSPTRFRFFAFLTVQVLLVVVAGLVFSQVGPHYNTSASFLSFFGLLNLYCYTIAFVFLPSPDNFRDRMPSHNYNDRDKDVHMMRMDDDDIMHDFHNL